MKKIILIFLLANVHFGFAQEQKIKSKTTITERVSSLENGEFTFETDVLVNCDLWNGINFMIGMQNFKILSYEYKDIKASSLDGISFPINIKAPQTNMRLNILFRDPDNWSKYFEIYHDFTAVTDGSWGGLERFWLKDEQKEKLFNYFGITNENFKTEFYKLKLEIVSVKTEINYYSSTVYDKLEKLKSRINSDLQDKKNKEDKIKSFRNRINSLGETETELNNKISVLKELQKLDLDNNYNTEIFKAELKLKNLIDEKQKEEKERIEKENEKNETKEDLSKDVDLNEEKRKLEEDNKEAERKLMESFAEEENKKQEAEKRAKESASAYNTYLDNVKSLKEMRARGQQNTQLYKDMLDGISLYEYSQDIPIEKREGTNFESKKTNKIYSGVDGNKSDTNAYNIQQETKENVAKVHKQSEIIGNELHGLANNITSSIFANQERKREQERLERERKEREREEKRREKEELIITYKTESKILNNLYNNMNEEEKENELNAYKEVLKNPTNQTCSDYLSTNYKLFRNNVKLINEVINLKEFSLTLTYENVVDLNYKVNGIELSKGNYKNYVCKVNYKYYNEFKNIFKNVNFLNLGELYKGDLMDSRNFSDMRIFLRNEYFNKLKRIYVYYNFGYKLLIDSNFNEMNLEYLYLNLSRDEGRTPLDFSLYKVKGIRIEGNYDEILKINLNKLEKFEELNVIFWSTELTKSDVKKKFQEIMNSLITLNNCKYKLDIYKDKTYYHVSIDKKK